MATESQTSYNSNSSLEGSPSYTRIGQRLTISDRTLTKLGFYLFKVLTPTGTLTFTIRKVSDDSLVASKLWGNSVDLPAVAALQEVTFDIPVYVNEAVRILAESSGGAGDGSNYAAISYQNTDVKGSEYYTRYSGSYGDLTTIDIAYVYTYDDGYAVPISAPVATTQAVSAITATTATGNGNVTSRGVPLATQHGHVVATFPNPTIANYDFITTNEAPSATGAYTSSLTGLTQNTLYYVRSYITNTAGPFYGQPVSFTTSGSTAVVTTKQPTSVLTTTAVGQGSIDNLGGTAVTAFGVCWSTSANPTTGDSHTDEGAGVVGDFYTAITGLTAGTLYHVRAYATNTSGTSYGSDLTFTTIGQGVPIVTIQATTSITPLSATGNGTIVDIGASAVTEHGHCWSTSVNPTTADSKTTLGDGSAGAFISTITGLTAGTGYYIRAYATNTQGTAYSDNELINGQTGAQIRTFGVLGEHLVYLSKSNKQRAILGTEF